MKDVGIFQRKINLKFMTHGIVAQYELHDLNHPSNFFFHGPSTSRLSIVGVVERTEVCGGSGDV